MANNRRVGRECALKMIFALRIEGGENAAQQMYEDFWSSFRFADDALGEPLETADEPLATATRLFAEKLTSGVLQNRSAIDEKIAAAAKNWSLSRMAPVDLSILRIAVYELHYCPDIPARVTLNEAIEIAKRYGTKDSPSFVNGLLDRIAQKVPA